MKVKRYKKFQRSVKFYTKNFLLTSPFHILVDGTFAKAVLDNKVNMREQLPKYLDDQIKLVTTPCALSETEKLGPELYGAVQVLKALYLFKCPHSEKPIPATKCIQFIASTKHFQKPKEFTENLQKSPQKHRNQLRNEKDPASDPNPGRPGLPGENVVLKYMIATQDPQLRKILRRIPGTALIYLRGSAPALEKPSKASLDVAEQKNLTKGEVLNYQKEILDKMKNDAFGKKVVPVKKGTKKRKRVGPNPLSCKKSKKPKKAKAKGVKGQTSKPMISYPKPTPTPTNPNPNANVTTDGVKKKRRRLRLPKHVKTEVKKPDL